VKNTIYALSSGSPPAAVAVVRISGPGADRALETLAGRLPKPRRASLATLSYDGQILDNALVLRFSGPHSATGEDIAELHLHGGRSVVAAVLAALGGIEGLRPALPGEFTRRAFENGRIDLTEAEGLADLLMAETDSQRRAALALAGGAMSRRIEQWQQRLLGLAAQLEAALDFADEGDVEEELPENWRRQMRSVIKEIELMLARPPAERLREGVRVVIAGPPNAGKSTLLNALTGREAAITSEIPGTTRDLVEAPTSIDGAPFLLIDTAGLRESSDRIETIGVERATASIDRADLILWLGDPADCPRRDAAILIHPKADLGGEANGDIAVSAATGEGMDRLVSMMRDRAAQILPQEGEVASNARHRQLLKECLEHLREAEKTGDPLVTAELLRLARAVLDRITGRAGVEQMLDALFGRFCIGK
jgi:tRNA modification GTPase